MNAISATADYEFNHAAFHELEPGVSDAARYDGWTPDMQKRFLTALSRGLAVSKACAIVGLSRQSAYALRASARGAAFALAWDAAHIRARDVLADELMDRAFNGVREHSKSDTNVTTRLRYDNQLAFKMLTRLDKRADAACTDTGATAARLAAADFEQMLDLIGRDAGPARAGLFLAARIGDVAVQASEDDLAPIRTLARADRWLRTNTDAGQGIDTSDLDPSARADWTGEQWARAEAAGLLQLAPPEPEPKPEPVETDQTCQLRQPPAFVDHDNPDNQPVWWDSRDEQWLTDFPPSEHFCGEEDGNYGEQGYSRTLDPEEVEAVESIAAAELALRLPADSAEREAWFAKRLAAAEAIRAAGTVTAAHRSPSDDPNSERTP